jgi:hypothetical protein
VNRLRELEQQVLEAGREWTRARLERDLQGASDTCARVCPKTGDALRQGQWRRMELRTVSGIVRLRVYCGYSVALRAWITPVRLAWGLESYERLSCELAARLIHTITEVGSYERAAAMSEVWGSPISDGALHGLVRRLGKRVADLKLSADSPKPSEAAFSLVIMMDGWLARTRGVDWGAGPRRKEPERVAWCEIKSAVIYRLDQSGQSASGRGLLSQKFIVATPPGTDPVGFGTAVQAEACRRGMARAEKVYLVMDGAVWLWDLAADRFSGAVKTLDFHHAREHLQAVADAEHGVGTAEARAWMKAMLADLRGGREARVLRRLEELLDSSPVRTSESQATVVREVGYFQSHRDHLHYRDRQREGTPRGSGAVESLGKQLQGRLRGCGQFWRRPGLANLLSLCVLVRNRDDHRLWD